MREEETVFWSRSSITESKCRPSDSVGWRASVRVRAMPDAAHGVGLVSCSWEDATEPGCVEGLKRAVGELARPGVHVIVMDLSSVRTADSSLVACLVIAHRLALLSGTELVVVVSPSLLDWVRVCGVRGVVHTAVADAA